MRLVLEAEGVATTAMPAAVAAFKLTAADRALDPAGKLATARAIVFDKRYAGDVAQIMAPMKAFEAALNTPSQAGGRLGHGRPLRAPSGCSRCSPCCSRSRWPASCGSSTPRSACVITRYRERLASRDAADAAFALVPAGTVELQGLAVTLNEQFRENRTAVDRNGALVTDMGALVREVTEAAGAVAASSRQIASIVRRRRPRGRRDRLSGVRRRAGR